MLRKIRSLVSNSDYIGIYDKALSKKECEILIKQFEKSDKIVRGNTVPNPEDTGLTKECSELSCQFEDKSIISNIVRPVLISCLNQYLKKYDSLDISSRWKWDYHYNFQKYDGEEEGYFAWHCEQCSTYPGRILAWMFYLNDAKCGTEFWNYSPVRARIGRGVIWPSNWTHVHRGVTPNKGLKYIITGWVSYTEDPKTFL